MLSYTIYTAVQNSHCPLEAYIPDTKWSHCQEKDALIYLSLYLDGIKTFNTLKYNTASHSFLAFEILNVVKV